MSSNLMFVLVAVGCLLAVWAMLGYVLTLVWKCYRSHAEVWHYDWEDINYDRQEYFCQKERGSHVR